MHRLWLTLESTVAKYKNINVMYSSIKYNKIYIMLYIMKLKQGIYIWREQIMASGMMSHARHLHP
jgi:hypothetical protein